MINSRLTLFLFAAIAALFVWLVLSLTVLKPAHAHDRSGYWARMASEGKAPTKEWWNSLASPGRGPCCSFSDGFKVEDVDWDTATVKDAKGQDEVVYRVRLQGKWINVDQDAVITSENRYGPAVVWPVCSFANGNGMAGQTPCGELDITSGKMRWNDGVQVWYIRCFLPGAGA